MLGYKYRVIMPGCLLAIIDRESWRQSFFNEVCSVLEDLIHSLFMKIIKLLLP